VGNAEFTYGYRSVGKLSFVLAREKSSKCGSR